ncbi:hypothetical protein NC652_004845 [Populus alba x Populus x berolinensis]|nr:hypothetical protein NC652_004845 [Populus alba x Populus x berolinensis]
MASVLTFACSVPAPVRASYGISQDTRPVWQENPVPSTWWSPLFLVDLPSPDYLNGNSSAGGTDKEIPGLSGSDQEPGRPQIEVRPWIVH